jgi:Tol biopolymer transport system component
VIAGAAPVGTRRRPIWIAVLAVAAIMLLAGRALIRTRPAPPVRYVQLTDFSETAFSPALSPDGRMVAFIVGNSSSFPPSGEVYSKLLPNGEAVQLTHDGWPKYGVAFSPNGAEIAYTVADARGWSTRVVPALGGEASLLVANAAGLTWLDDRRLLFAEITSGLHMGLVTASLARSDVKRVYLPPHERAMAHYGYPSPDRRFAVVVEMGPTGAWERCRLVPLDGSSDGQPVGPNGYCTGAGWAPDGSQMYFTAGVDGATHVWRQPFPNGRVEQLTFGPVEEDGIAVMPNGRSIVTSAGISENGAWLHTRAGDRLLDAEGLVAQLSFSRDGQTVYYLRRRGTDRTTELWKVDVASGRKAPVVKNVDVRAYDLSPDETRLVFSEPGQGGGSQIAIATADGTIPPTVVTTGGDGPRFGPDGHILFRAAEGTRNYLFEVDPDTKVRKKVLSTPITDFKGMSPDRQWAVVMVAVDGLPSTSVVAVPVRGDRAQVPICPAECMAAWSPDGRRFYVEPLLQSDTPGMGLAIPVPAGLSLPPLPPRGVAPANDAAIVAGSTTIDLSAMDASRVGTNVAPGLEPDTFAYSRRISHRNLFELRLE